MATLGSKQVVEADPSVHDQVSVAASQQVGTMNKLLDPDPEI
jgi:hypothetical protein